MSDSITRTAPFMPAIYIDLRKCIGCDACSLACKQENNVQIGELWNQVYGSESGDYPRVNVQVLTMLCQQCPDAPCKRTCDSLGYRAIIRRPDGILYVDAARCMGCQRCIPVCPYNSMAFNTQTKKAEKCHLCMHRIDKGLEPACVITCLAVTREYGDLITLMNRHPGAEAMGDDGLRILYDRMGDEPKRRTAGYPDAAPCHD